MCGSFEVVYQNRKRLEDCKNLHVWLTRVFGTTSDTFVHRRVFDEPHPPRNAVAAPEIGSWQVNIGLEVKERLVHCYPIEPGGSLLACVYDNGNVVFGKLSLSSEENLFEPVGEPRQIKDLRSATVSPVLNGLAVYVDYCLTVLTDKASIELDELYLRMCTFSENICQVSETELRHYQIESHGISFTKFTVLPALIKCFASCQRFYITAVGCDDGKLRIRSLLTGRKVATIDLGEVPIVVIITPNWGLIVVQTISSLFVCDPNGFPVAKIPHLADFAVFTTFGIRDGSDFVAFQDSSYNAFYFEAANPAVMIPLNAGNMKLICMDYDARMDRFFFVAESGKVLVVSRMVN
jgi:hypothetical protein